MKKISLRKAYRCACIEYFKWICNARMIVLGILFIFIYNFVISPLLANAELMEAQINILEPFIALANSGTVMLILPLVFMTIAGDFPEIGRETMLIISRTGRENWLLGQIFKLIFMILTYLLVIFLGAVIPVIGRGYVGSEWSDVVTEFADRFPEYSQNIGVKLLPENLYYQLKVVPAALISYFLMAVYMFIIGMLLFLFTMLKAKRTGMLVCGAIVGGGCAFCALDSAFMWGFPMANSIIWLHYTKYFRRPTVSLAYSLSYLAIAVVMLTLLVWTFGTEYSFDGLEE